MKRILEVQKEIGTLSKNAKNPFFKSAYLDLNDLLTHITPLLHKQGLILLQPLEDGNVGSVIIDSENGKNLCESVLALPDLKDPQKLGSAITYFRRYTLKSLLAIAEGDDDGNLASQPAPKEKPVLNDAGFKFLTEQGTIDQIKLALSDRKLTDVQKKALDIQLKELQNGSK
jgi:hypothetical protein